MKLKANKKESLTATDSPITLAEFRLEIKKAERGPFYTPGQAKKLLASWRR